MSWLISKALFNSLSANLPCSLAPVAASLADCFSAGAASVQLSATDTPPPLWWRDKTTAVSRLSRFGIALKLSTGDLGAALLTLFRQAFPVRTSALPATAKGLTATNPDCGSKLPASLVKWDRASSCWKTAQCSLFADLDVFSDSWPAWGMMRNGECWALPTPSVLAAGRASTMSEIASGLLPRFMTPNARDWKDCGSTQGNRKSPNLGTQVGGRLNPTWAEWLMGWPVGWTALEPLATDSFRSWLRSQRRVLGGVCDLPAK